MASNTFTIEICDEDRKRIDYRFDLAHSLEEVSQ
jgi:hypothetical protein